MERPLHLGSGGDSETYFSAYSKFAPGLRTAGALGWAVTILCFDGHLRDSLFRLMAADNEAYYHGGDVGDDKYHRELLHLKDWIAVLPCVAHVCHLAAKWAMSKHLNAEISDDLWAIVAALRNTFLKIHKGIKSFVMSSAVVRDEKDVVPTELVRIFWFNLGVTKADVFQLFIDVDPLFVGGNILLVNPGSISVEVGTEKIEQCLAYAFKWSYFSSSRWFGHFFTSRQLLLSVASGVKPIVDKILLEGEYGSHHAQGFGKVNNMLLNSISVAALALRPLNYCLVQIMKDDRVLLHYTLLQGLLAKHLNELYALPEFVFERLASFYEGSSGVLRTQVVNAALKSVAFLDREALLYLRTEFQFCLCIGDIEENVESLDMSNPGCKFGVGLKISKYLAAG